MVQSSRKQISYLTLVALLATQPAMLAGDTSPQREALEVDGRPATCDTRPGGAQAIEDLPVVAPSAPGPWRGELKLEEPRSRVPGTDAGRVISPSGPARADLDTAGRWLPGYRPNTPQAQAEFDRWKNEQRRALGPDAAAAAVPHAPAGTPANQMLGPGGETPLIDDEITYLVREEEEAPSSPIDLREPLPIAAELGGEREEPSDFEPHTGLTWEDYRQLKEAAQSLPETPEAQAAEELESLAPGPFGVVFDALPSSLISVPPDPILAVGPNHIVAMVNSKYRVWNKTGVAQTAEISMNTFFGGVANCVAGGGSTEVFDVFADYDEAADRFVLGGIALNTTTGASYLCVAASATGDPTGTWNRFSFRSDQNATGTFSDYPHTGIGLDGVFVGANMFNDAGGFNHIRLFALDKADLYANTPLSVAEAGVGASFLTAQPAKLHGFTSGGWPAPGTPHHIIAHNFAGLSRIWRWVNPLSQAPTVYGNVVETFNGAPPNAPESGDSTSGETNLNDTGAGQWFDAESRDGKLWATRSVGCNLGGGSAEACLDWVMIDVTGASPVLLDQQAGGAYGSADQFRYYPDAAVDRNNNLALGYTRSSFSTFTDVWVTGRLFSDAAGTLQAEALQRAGLGNYTDGAGCDGGCDRWGDYTGMTVDPDGCTFWYLGQFSDGGSANWKTSIGSWKFSDCSVSSSLQLDSGTYTCEDSLTVTITDSIRIDAATASAQAAVTTAGDSETVPAASWLGSDCVGNLCAAWTATLTTSDAAGSNNDGTLNVADGDSISATYTDPHGGHSNQTRAATVSCATRFDDGGFLVAGGCENGSGTEQYRDYLDAGEYIDYSFGIFNPGSAPALSDVEVTLSVSGPAAAHVTIFNPTVYIGPVGQGALTAPVFHLFIGPGVDTPGLRLSLNDLELSITSAADGFTVPQVLTQQQYVQADDNIVRLSQCYNFEGSDQGFVRDRYAFSYTCGAGEGCAPTVTVNTVAAPWTRGSGCGSETRTDYPEMTCDSGGTSAFKANGTAGSCTNFAQSGTTLTDDILYSAIISPQNTGNAGNGQPWFFRWLFAEWFYRSDMQTAAPATAAAWGHYWSDNYTGLATPASNEVDTYPWFLGFFFYPNQDWDSATPWNPSAVPANYDGVAFSTEASGPASTGLKWRWAIEMFDADFGGNPTATAATPGVAYDDLNLVYDQYHAQAQVGTCGSAVGTVAFDQFSYFECPAGALGISVLDGNAAGPVTVTLTADGTGDSETFTIAGPGPYFASAHPYSTAGGSEVDDGTLYVTPSDIVRASYGDGSPVGTSTAAAFVGCDSGEVVVDGVVGLEDNGDADDYPDTNETVDLALQIRNNTEAPLTNVVAYIATSDTTIDCIPKNHASFGTIPPGGGTAANNLASDPFTFKVASTVACSDPATPPKATFTVFIVADGLDGPVRPQTVELSLDLNDLPGTVTFNEPFTTQPANFAHEVGPGDDDAIASDPSGIACSPYVDEFFWRSTGGNPGGGFFAWQNPADNFPNGTYSDLNDSVLLSPTLKIGASSTTLSFQHEYKFASTSTLRADGARVDYRINGGVWQKLTTLGYDGSLIFNSYCNPLCNGGVFGAPCFSENANGGENVFCLLSNGLQNWVGESGALAGLTSGDSVQFRWRVGSMNTSQYSGLSTQGGYGLDNVSVTNVVLQACDAAVHPDTGCNVVFDSAGGAVEVCGDGDAIVEPSEQWEVDVTLRKLGPTAAVATVADLAVNAGSAVEATIIGNPQGYGTIAGGGTATATYALSVDPAAACVDDLTLDVANISDSSTSYPDELAAFAVPVGAATASEAAIQNLDIIRASNATVTALLGPPFTLSAPVSNATVDYDFAYDATVTATATQTTSPINAMNAITGSTLTPAFSIPGGSAIAATVNWASLTYAGVGGVTNCSRVILRTPNGTDVILKDLNVAAANPYNVLATYQGGNGGPGTYTIRLEERSGGGCNGTATLAGTTMTVTGSTPGTWTANAKVSLFDGTTSHVLKNFGVADASPYDVTSIYGAAGPDTYELRVQESGGGGAAIVTGGEMVVAHVDCDLGCTSAIPPPPVADGSTGTGILAGKGAGPNDVLVTIDDATCSSDHAVVLYGNFGNFSGYQGAVGGCNLGPGPSGTITQSGSFWFNVLWVDSSGTAGHPGQSSSGPRTWDASGLCGVVADNPADDVCN